jgi:alkylation response protein AidB-like acyl-CoA dehydrogenase
MELDFSADQDALRDTIQAVLAKEAPIGLARRVSETGGGADALWSAVRDLGWAALCVPEEYGGIGLGPVEVAILAEELGRVVAPGPLLATVALFTPLVAALGSSDQQRHWLGAVAAGDLAATVAHHGGSVVATIGSESVRLNGTKRSVIEARAAGAIACTATTPEGGSLVVILEPGEAQLVPVDSIDATRALAHVVLDDVEVPTARILGADAAAGPASGFVSIDAIDDALLSATVALALETVGVCQSIFDVALEHAKQRVQFGAPIGSFQAIKHKFADMIVALERARATGYFAALCVAERDERAAITASAAKAAAGDCQRRLAKEGIQILGGIGCTWEHDMQLYVKRAKADDALFGGAAHHRARIADLLGV